MASDEAVVEADKLYKKGLKMLKGNLFSKGKPEEAEKVLIEGKNKLRFLKPRTEASVDLLLQILEAITECQFGMNLFNTAGQTMEEAYRLTTEMKAFAAKSPQYLQKAAYYYQMSSQFEQACKLLQKSAELIGDNDIDEAIKIFDQCVSIEETENRYQLCHEFFDAAVKFCVDRRRFKEATNFLERQIKQYENDSIKFVKRIYRNIISLMIINFAQKNVKQAQQIYYEAVSKYGPSSAEEQFATKLLTVFEKADAEGLKALQKEQDFALYLINSVAKLGKKLDMIDIQPLVILEDKINNNPEVKQLKEEMKEDIKDEQLKSDVHEVNIGDDGAPII